MKAVFMTSSCARAPASQDRRGEDDLIEPITVAPGRA